MLKKGAKNELLKDLTDGINNQSSSKKNDIISIDLLIPYANHPFDLYTGDRLLDMTRSIKEMGVLLPIIVRPVDEPNKYEILSGHNRVNAAKEAGLTSIPAIIKNNISDEEAKLIVTETNLIQRSFADLSYKEKTIALKVHMDAVKTQGKRTDLINEINMLLNPDEIEENGIKAQVEPKLTAREKTAEKYGLSRANVTRYLRLNHLIQSLLDRIDTDEIAFLSAVSLSYLSTEEQEELDRLLDENKFKIDMKKADTLRDLSENKKLTSKIIEEVLSGKFNKKPKMSSSVKFKLKNKIITKYFAEQNSEEIEAEIIEAIEFFRKYKETITTDDQ